MKMGFARNALLLVVALAVAACSSSAKTKRWTEEVQLDDGVTILVDREVTFSESNALGGGAYNAVESASFLRFKGALVALPPWSAPLIAQVLYHDTATSEWVVVAISRSCEVWAQRGRPKPPHWEFRLGTEGWRAVPLSAASIGRRSNLLINYAQSLPQGLITVRQKRDELDIHDRSLEHATYAESKYRIVVDHWDPSYCQGQ